MPRKMYLGTNTKMYKGARDTVSFLTALGELTADVNRAQAELFVIPSYTALESAGKAAKRAGIRLGAQNMCWEDEGQFTGEISPLMLKELGVEIVEIGHSERRHNMGETDVEENRKVLAALRHGFAALLCVGETEEQLRYGVSDETLRTQLKIGLYGVAAESAHALRIAYEPVWAIGVNGKPAHPDYVEEKHTVLRNTLEELFGSERGRHVPILYGGSVNNTNALPMIGKKNVDGLFIGRSAWNAENFSRIIHDVMAVV